MCIRDSYDPGDALGTYQFVHTGQTPPIQTVSFNNLHTDSDFGQAFRDLGPGSSATFRIVFHDDVNASASTHRIDDVELRGFQALAVPEPSSLMAIALVGGIVVLRRRR